MEFSTFICLSQEKKKYRKMYIATLNNIFYSVPIFLKKEK